MQRDSKRSKAPLTMRQEEVLRFISKTIHEKQRAPSLREIAAHLGVVSTNGINDHLEKLVSKGYISRDSLISRGISLTTPGSGSVQEDISAQRIDLCEIGRNGTAEEVSVALEAVRSLRLSMIGRSGADG